jgi:hypothetical protein
MALRSVAFVAAGLVLAGVGVVSCTALADAPLRTQGDAAIVVITAPTVPPAPPAVSPTPTVDPMAGIPGESGWGRGPIGQSLPSGLLPTGPRPAVTDNRVFLLGDSILLSTGNDYSGTLGEMLAPLGWKWTMDAKVGRNTEDGRRVLDRRRGEVHQVAVVFLGNNYDGDEVRFAGEIDRILALLDSVPRVLLVTVQEYRSQQAEVNDVLWEKAAARPGQVQLVDWATLASTTAGINGNDGLHLNDRGTELLARLLGEALGPAPLPSR